MVPLLPDELCIQKKVENYLDSKDISPQSVIFVSGRTGSIPILKITFWLDFDIDSFKKIIDFRSMCDKSGYMEFKDNNTIILSGIVLAVLFKLIESHGKD